ncbi:alpha/beta hydrolase [Elioraea tepida]|uniref:Alpha/beta hydrolase n=1 Tax=Elioraea tepida TaxID=2843330 RepID=A0A975U5W9_9PROT|nr:alpha/beta hydrolase [Elioraea tepida]
MHRQRGLRAVLETPRHHLRHLDRSRRPPRRRRHIEATRRAGPLLVYGISSGALKAALFAERNPGRVARLALDAFVWTGKGSPTLEQRRKKLPEYLAGGKRRPIDRAFVHSIFTRDHPGTAKDDVVDAFADAILALDDSVPIGTYVDMCLNLPVVDPERITCPTIVMRGEYDGIAAIDDLIEFFRRLPNPDKQFAVMPGIAHASSSRRTTASCSTSSRPSLPSLPRSTPALGPEPREGRNITMTHPPLMPGRRATLAGLSAAALAAALPGSGAAQGAFPTRNFRVVIPTGQGGGAERLARSFDDAWSRLLGRQFEYEFFPGAAG